MRVLVACEFSGIVRHAFRARGYDAWSCDLLEAEDMSPFHLQADALEVGMREHWDLVIAHPPCTYLAVSGARWFRASEERIKAQDMAVKFFMEIANLRAERIAIENPVCIMSTRWRKPDQIIQPWMFGHGETKATCLWLKGLPKLVATNIVQGRAPKVHHESPGPERWKNRSRTKPGIAAAMAEQWGNIQHHDR